MLSTPSNSSAATFRNPFEPSITCARPRRRSPPWKSYTSNRLFRRCDGGCYAAARPGKFAAMYFTSMY